MKIRISNGIGNGILKNYRVDYDEFGFPKFEQYCPDGFNANQSSLSSYLQMVKQDLMVDLMILQPLIIG